MDVPSAKNSGHAIYKKQKALKVDGKVVKEKVQQYDQLGQSMDDLYSSVSRFSNATWKSSLDSSRPEFSITAGLADSQVPGSAEARIKKPDNDSVSGRTSTAGRPSQSKNAETSFQSNETVFGKSIFEVIASAPATSSGNISWKSALDSSRPLDSMSPSSKGRKGLPASGENQPSTTSSDRVITAGRQSSEKKRTAVVKSSGKVTLESTFSTSVSLSANTSWKTSLNSGLPDAEIKAGSASHTLLQENRLATCNHLFRVTLRKNHLISLQIL